MRTAYDIMTPRPKTIMASEHLEDAIRTFLEQGITVSPIIDHKGDCIGLLSELSLVKAYMLHRAKLHKSDRVGHHVDLLDAVNYVDEETPLSDVLKEMIASPTHRVLVRDSMEKVVGIISPKDLMRAMIGQVNPAQNIKEKLRETEDKLRTSLEKLQTIEKHLHVYEKAFHETPYMMHAVNKEGKILMANKREHDVLGYQEGELVGKTIYDLYAKPMHHEATQGLKKIMQTGSHHVTYTTLVKKDGSGLRCDIASSALFNEKGDFLSTISVLRPIDPDELIRIVDGIVADKNGPLAKYAAKADAGL